MAPRSRTVEGSCNGCNTNRVRCDLERPSCQVCFNKNQECHYGRKLQWVNAVASRGHFSGKKIPVCSKESHVKGGVDEKLSIANTEASFAGGNKLRSTSVREYVEEKQKVIYDMSVPRPLDSPPISKSEETEHKLSNDFLLPVGGSSESEAPPHNSGKMALSMTPMFRGSTKSTHDALPQARDGKRNGNSGSGDGGSLKESGNVCDSCRMRKIRCDRTDPICGPCSKRPSGQQSCVYSLRLKDWKILYNILTKQSLEGAGVLPNTETVTAAHSKRPVLMAKEEPGKNDSRGVKRSMTHLGEGHLEHKRACGRESTVNDFEQGSRPGVRAAEFKDQYLSHVTSQNSLLEMVSTSGTAGSSTLVAYSNTLVPELQKEIKTLQEVLLELKKQLEAKNIANADEKVKTQEHNDMMESLQAKHKTDVEELQAHYEHVKEKFKAQHIDMVKHTAVVEALQAQLEAERVRSVQEDECVAIHAENPLFTFHQPSNDGGSSIQTFPASTSKASITAVGQGLPFAASFAFESKPSPLHLTQDGLSYIQNFNLLPFAQTSFPWGNIWSRVDEDFSDALCTPPMDTGNVLENRQNLPVPTPTHRDYFPLIQNWTSDIQQETWSNLSAECSSDTKSWQEIRSDAKRLVLKSSLDNNLQHMESLESCTPTTYLGDDDGLTPSFYCPPGGCDHGSKAWCAKYDWLKHRGRTE